MHFKLDYCLLHLIHINFQLGWNESQFEGNYNKLLVTTPLQDRYFDGKTVEILVKLRKFGKFSPETNKYADLSNLTVHTREFDFIA